MGHDYVFKKTPQFRKSYEALSSANQALADEAFKKFKADPYDASLRIHKINRLSAIRGTTVRSIVIAGNLRAVFTIKDNVIISEDIGTHDIYK
jgi:hypothetical protein